MNETGCVERMPVALTDESSMGQSLELVIHKGHYAIQRLGITTREGLELRRYLGIRFHFDGPVTQFITDALTFNPPDLMRLSVVMRPSS